MKDIKRMILAAGTQSGGTTLVSWCFLQHPMLDGELDMASDRIQIDLSRVATPMTWIKMTHYSFRWREVAEVYRLLGYKISPLLIVRNPYLSYASLKHKWYGRNAVTAEDPPLVVRFLRFFDDWRLFMRKGWPVIQFEQFLTQPETVLRQACEHLDIPYDDAMLNWPKPISELAYVNEVNETFGRSLQGGGMGMRDAESVPVELSPQEVEWIGTTLRELIEFYGYDVPPLASCDTSILPEPFDSRRYIGFGSSPDIVKVSTRVERLVQLLQAQSRRRVYIYGSGEVARYLYWKFKACGISVEAFFDSVRTSANVVDNIGILPYQEQCFDARDAVVIGSIGSADAIASNLEAMGCAARVYRL